MRIPVMVKLYDADLKEHTFGPVIVEIEEPQDIGWEWWTTVDNRAREYLLPDLTCDGIEAAIMLPKGFKP